MTRRNILCKLSIFVPLVLAAAFIILAGTVSGWWLVPYLIGGIILGLLTGASLRNPNFYVVFTLFWIIWPMFAAILCWERQNRDKNLVEMIPVIIRERASML